MTESKEHGRRVEGKRYSTTDTYIYTHIYIHTYIYACTQTDDKDMGKRRNRGLVEGKRHV
jgi:hypothetical protein